MLRPAHRAAAVALACALALAACAAGGAESAQAAHGGVIAHFLLGFWHGLIAPVILLGEIGHKIWPHAFPWTLRIYEVRLNAVAYDLGFLMGLGGGPVVVARRRLH